MLEQIREILKDYTDRPITESSAIIEDLELDSFTIVYFLTQIEDQFEIEIDEAEFPDIVAISDIMERIRRGGQGANTKNP